jgi:hypothetical protein
MMTSPGFDGGWDNNVSSKGTMEAVLALEDASTSPSHDPRGQSTTNHTIQLSCDEECQLGATFLMPVSECIAHMAPNTATEDALLDLYTTLSRAGAQLYLFDEIIAFIEWHVSTTFQKGNTLPCKATLIKQMADKHSVPPPDSVPVDAKKMLLLYKSGCLNKLCRNTFLTPSCLAIKAIWSMLVIPWENTSPPIQMAKKCLPASYWYNKTWDENVTDPNTQFLLCLKAYIDKTGKSAGLTSYCGKPFLLSALHLKKSVQEQWGAWLGQAYLPDLEAGSSAKKKKYSHSNKTCGRTNCNYHKVMEAVLQGVHAAQQRGGGSQLMCRWVTSCAD